MQSPNRLTVGIFDSGVGGLSVLRALRAQLPEQAIIYFADQAHVPYGSRPLDEVRRFSENITRFLQQQGARVIVVACNTASAAALHTLRSQHPETIFVGMEPAVKPASEHTRTGAVGVLATPATFQGALYAGLVERFAASTRIFQHTCPGLVEEIEAGRHAGAQADAILREAIEPMLAAGVDTLVLGCTHYPFVIPLIRQIVGAEIEIIDPAPAVARQTSRVLASLGQAHPTGNPTATLRVITSGDPVQLTALLPVLTGETAIVQPAVWHEDSLNLI